MTKNAQNVSVKFSSDNSTNSAKMPENGSKSALWTSSGQSRISDNRGPVVYDLAEILNLWGMEPTMKAFDLLAADLSKIADQKPAWKKKYVHSVYHGYVLPSPKFAWAVSTLAQQVDGSPAAGMVYVKVLANPDIPEGVVIPAGAKVVKCARPGCPVMFVKTNPNQKYHNQSCREGNRK